MISSKQSTVRPTNWVTLECTSNNSTGPHDSLLAKVTRGISSGLGHMVAIITRINTQALMCSQIIHRKNLLNSQGIYFYRVIISNNENYSVG